MTSRRTLLAAVAAAALVAAGCGPGKLNVDAAFTLDGAAKAFDTPPQGSAQTIKVEVTADNPVNVYVLLNTTAEAAAALEESEVKGKAKESKLNTKADTFTVSVPANQGVAVWVGLGDKTKKATGKVKMTN